MRSSQEQGEDPGTVNDKGNCKGEGKGDGKVKGRDDAGKDGKEEPGKEHPAQPTPPAGSVALPEPAEGEEGPSNRKRRRFLKLQENLTNMVKLCGLEVSMDAKPLPLQNKLSGRSMKKGYLLPVKIVETSTIKISIDAGATSSTMAANHVADCEKKVRAELWDL